MLLKAVHSKHFAILQNDCRVLALASCMGTLVIVSYTIPMYAHTRLGNPRHTKAAAMTEGAETQGTRSGTGRAQPLYIDIPWYEHTNSPQVPKGGHGILFKFILVGHFFPLLHLGSNLHLFFICGHICAFYLYFLAGHKYRNNACLGTGPITVTNKHTAEC